MYKTLLLLGLVLFLVGCGSSDKSSVLDSTDSTAPTITLIGGSSISQELGADFIDPGSSVTDDRDGSLTAFVIGSVDVTTPGDYVLTYSATDSSNNIQSVDRVVTVTDTINPIVSVPADISVGAVNGASVAETDTAIQTFLSAVSFDDYDTQTIVANDAPATFLLGTTLVTFTATDSAGNIGTASASVTVTDAERPVVTPPDSLIVVAPNGAGAEVTDTKIVGFLSSADFSDSDADTTLINDAPETFPFGDTTVTFTATDSAGNTGTASAIITVSGEVQAGNLVKGPLYNAKVFLDYDDDGTLNANEPSVMTETDGSFSLVETTDAPANYSLVAVMEEGTTDYLSGESFAGTGIILKANEGSTVITPLTTILSEAQQFSGAPTNGSSKPLFSKTVAVDSFSDSDLLLALGLPASIDVSTFNPFAEGADPALALAVEKTSQQIMTATLLISDSIKGASGDALDAGTSVAAALNSIVKVVIESSKIVKGEGSENVENITGSFDFSDPLHLAELNEFVEDDLVNGDLATELETAGVTVSPQVLELALDKAAEVVEQVSKAFDTLTVDDFGTTQSNAVSLLKQDAAAEIFSVAAAAATLVDTGGDLSTFDASAYVTLDSQANVSSSVTSNVETADEYSGSLSDNTAPVIVAPADITVAAVDALGVGADIDTIVSFIAGATATDDVTNNVVVTNDAPATFPLGATTVTFNALDRAGNAAVAVSAIVNVTDQTNPVVSLVGSSEVQVNKKGEYNDAGATAVDNVDGGLNVSYRVVAGGPTKAISIPPDVTNGRGPDNTLNTADDVTVKGSYVSGALTFTRPPTGAEAPFASWCDGKAQCTNSNTSSASKPWVGANVIFRKMPYNAAVAWCESKNGRLPTRQEIKDHLLPIGSGGVFQDTMVTPDPDSAGWPQQQSKYWTSDAPATNAAKRFVFTPRKYAASGEAGIPPNHFTNTADVDNPAVPGSRVWAMCVGPTEPQLPTVRASDLFFSEYAEAGANYGKYLEIYNPTDAAISLDDYFIGRVSNAASTDGEYEGTIEFASGASVPSNGTYVIARALSDDSQATSHDAHAVVMAIVSDPTKGEYIRLTHNGNDAYKLYKKANTDDSPSQSATVIDAFGTFTTGSSSPNNHTACGQVDAGENSIWVKKSGFGPNIADNGSFGTNQDDCAWTIYVHDTTDNSIYPEVPGYDYPYGTSIGSHTYEPSGPADIGLVDTSTPGIYTVIYSASDSAGNTGSVNRTVDVYDTFELAADQVVLNDYAPGSQSTMSNEFLVSYAGGAVNVDLRGAPLDITNIQNAISGGDFESPTLSFGLANLPAGSGSSQITINLFDGADTTIDSGERKVTATLTVDWNSDGTTSSIILPAQTISAFYVNQAGTRVDVAVDNLDADLISVTAAGADLPASLNIKLLSALTKVSSLVSAESLLDSGVYTVQVVTDLPLASDTYTALTELNATLEIMDAYKLGSTSVTLNDYYPESATTKASEFTTTFVDGVLSLDATSAPINLLNMQNAINGGTFDSPTISFALENLPVGTGTDTVEIALVDGVDGVHDIGERLVYVPVVIDWVSDGSSASVTMPIQTLTGYYVDKSGTRIDVQIQNGIADVITVTGAGAETPASLNVKILAAFDKVAAFESVGSLLAEGTYTVSVKTALPLTYTTGARIATVNATFAIEDIREKLGFAVKGPLFKAEVCLDYNGNSVCDFEEPLVETAADGSYSLMQGGDAPANYSVIVAMGPETVDSSSGESYADTGVVLKAPSTAKVITPLTTMFVAAVEDLEVGETFTEADFKASLGLPEAIDLETFNPAADDADPALALEAEVLAQNVMTAMVTVAEAVKATASSAGVTVSPEEAVAAAIKSIATVAVETSKVQKGETSTVTGITGSLDFSNTTHLANIQSAVVEDLQNTEEGGLGALIASKSETAEVSADVVAAANYVLERTNESTAAVASAFNALTVDDFGTNTAAAVSRIKQQAAAEIAELSTAVVEEVQAAVSSGATLDLTTSVDASSFVTLTDASAITLQASLNESQVTLYQSSGPSTQIIDTNGNGIADSKELVISSTSVKLTDHYSGVLQGVTSVFNFIENQGVLSVDMQSAPLNLRNMTNALNGGSHTSPKVSVDVGSLPAGGGTDTFEFTLIDGGDSSLDLGERKLTALVTVNWQSDGATTRLSMPPQLIPATYTLRSGTEIGIEFANFGHDDNLVMINADASSTLTFDLLKILTKANVLLPGMGVSLFEAGVYNVSIKTSIGLISPSAVPVESLNATLRVFDPFTLNADAITLHDYSPVLGTMEISTLTPTVSGDTLMVNTSAAPLNLKNIQNALTGGDFQSPMISFGLANLPMGSGSGTVNIQLLDGLDDEMDVGERKVVMPVQIDWVSNGMMADITLPEQMITATYTLRSGTDVNVEVANADSDMITVTAAGPEVPPTLDVKILSAIAKVNALVSAESLLEAGTYNLKMTTDLPLASATGEQISSVMAVVKIADAFKLSAANVVLTDYDPSTKTDVVSTLMPTIVDGMLQVDTTSQPLTLLNIENTLSAGDFRTPMISFGLDYLPVGSGSETVSIMLLDGTDSEADIGERKLTLTAKMDWYSDGTTASFTFLDQPISATYTTHTGTVVDVELANVASDILSVSAGGVTTPASLDLKILGAISKARAILPGAESLLREGSYNLSVTTSGLVLRASNGTKVEGLRAIVAIAGSVPEITPPSNISLEVASSSSTVARSDSAIQSFLNGASFVDFSPTPAVLTNDAPSVFPIGVTPVIFTLTSSSGKTSIATATVTLNEAGAPVVTAPSSISVTAANSSGIAKTNSAIASFLSGGSYTAFESPDATITNNAPNTLPIGETVVTFSVNDNRGKTGSASAIVTVTKAANPVVSAPSNITVKTQESSGGIAKSDSTIAAFLADATASASASTPYPSPTATITNDAPSTFPYGDTTVTFTATDDGGQTATATAKVTVAWSITIPQDLIGNGPDGDLSAAADNVTVKGSYVFGDLTFIRPPTRSEAASATYGTGSRAAELTVGTNLFYRAMLYEKAAAWCSNMNGRLVTASEVTNKVLGAGGFLGGASNGVWVSDLKWPQTPNGGTATHYWTGSPPYGADDTSTKRRVLLTKYPGGGSALKMQAQLWGSAANKRHLPLCVGDN